MIFHTLTRCCFSWKQFRSVVVERNEELRLDWKRKISGYKPEQLVFLDESACSEKIACCCINWLLFGIALQAQQRLHCCERFSILFVYILDSYITYRVIPGSYNSECFLQFVAECVLPLLTPRYHVICLDNMNTHRSTVSFFVVIIFVHFYRHSRSYVTPQALGMNIYCRIHLILTWLRRALRPWKLGCGVIICWRWSVQKGKTLFLL